MDFSLNNEQLALRDAIRELAARVGPNDTVGPPPFPTEAWRALTEMGVVAEEGLGPIEEMIVAEELGRARIRTPYADTVLTSHLLRAAGLTDLLAQVGSGAAVVVPALSEPGRAWGSASTLRHTDGSLTGVADPVAWLDAATHAVCVSDGTAYLVSELAIVGTGLSFARTEAQPLPEFGAALNRGTVALCAEALGAMSAALELTVEYLKTRRQFGQPLMSFQTLTQRAAQMYVHLELARSAVQYGAMTLAEGSADAAATVSRVKAVVGKSGRLIGQEAIQLHGGIGMTAEYAVGHFTARLTAIENTWGNTRQHLAELGRAVGGYPSVNVI